MSRGLLLVRCHFVYSLSVPATPGELCSSARRWTTEHSVDPIQTRQCQDPITLACPLKKSKISILHATRVLFLSRSCNAGLAEFRGILCIFACGPPQGTPQLQLQTHGRQCSPTGPKRPCAQAPGQRHSWPWQPFERREFCLACPFRGIFPQCLRCPRDFDVSAC